METPNVPISAPSPQGRRRIAVVTMGVKLGDETRGYTRFRFLSELLVREGFEVDLITSSFQHWDKAHRDTSKACYQGLPYNIVFIDEPGYRKNLDLARIRSHHAASKRLRAHFEERFVSGRGYDLVYAEIPPNDVARVCAEAASAHGVPFVADINDLWPEAMRMVANVPVLCDVAFYPFARDARRVYELLSGAVGTSDEYAARPAKDRDRPYPKATVYVGNDLAAFDAGAAQHAGEVAKPAGELWVTYAGTLGASYDVATLVQAAALLEARRTEQLGEGGGAVGQACGQAAAGGGSVAGVTAAGQAATDAAASHPGDTAANAAPISAAPALPPIRIKVLGDGPDRDKLEALAAELGAPADFLGYTDYPLMAAYLCASDIVVNSLVKAAAQSIVTKIGDYLASGKPMINTGSSPEFCAKVASDGFGLNVEAEDARALADAIAKLAHSATMRKAMGAKGRAVAEREFDQPRSYQAIVNLIRNLL